MANRADRRKTKKNTPAYKRESYVDVEKRLYQNGISYKDLKENYDKGWNAGFRDGCTSPVKTCYAAFCLVLKDIGFDKQMILDCIQRTDDKMINSLSSAEIIQQVLDECGIELDFGEAFDRVLGKEEQYGAI